MPLTPGLPKHAKTSELHRRRYRESGASGALGNGAAGGETGAVIDPGGCIGRSGNELLQKRFRLGFALMMERCFRGVAHDGITTCGYPGTCAQVRRKRTVRLRT